MSLAPEQCQGTGGWNRHFPWLQPGTEVTQRPTTLRDPSTVGPPHQHRKLGVPTAPAAAGGPEEPAQGQQGPPAGFVHVSRALGSLGPRHPRAAIAVHAPSAPRPQQSPAAQGPACLVLCPTAARGPQQGWRQGNGADTEPPATLTRPPAPRPGSPLPSALSTILPGSSPGPAGRARAARGSAAVLPCLGASAVTHGRGTNEFRGLLGVTPASPRASTTNTLFRLP